MRSGVRLVTTLAFALLVAAPSGIGHGGHDGGYRQGRETGDHYVFVQTPAPAPPILTARTDLPFQITVYNRDPFATTGTGVQNLTLVWRSPANETARTDVERLQRDTWFSETSFAERGRWTLNVTLLPQNTSADFLIDVYGESPWIIDIAPGRGAGLVAAENLGRQKFDVRDWRQGSPSPEVKDAQARLVRWDPATGERTLHGEAPLKSDGAGRLVLEARFGAEGAYELYVASETLGLSFEDRPPIIVEAVSREAALAYGVEIPASTPGPGFPLFALAVLAVVLARRGR